MSLTGKIIQSVKMHPVLYDPQHEDFRNTHFKEEIWQKIGRKLKRDGNELKKKWKNIKDTYGKHLKCSKMKNVRNKKNYERWQWAHEMNYFRPYLACSKLLAEDDDGAVTADEEDEEFVKNMILPEDSAVEHIEVTPLTNMTGYESPSEGIDSTTMGKMPSYKSAVDPVDMIFQGYAQMVKTFSIERQAYIKLKIAELMSEQEIAHHKEQQASDSTVK